jgi:hypothetical protein
MSKALPSYCYKDPMDVLDQKQQRELKKTCIGCVHAFEIMFKSGAEKGCNQGKLYGKRCSLFQVKK